MSHFSYIPSVHEILQLSKVLDAGKGLSRESIVKSIRHTLNDVRSSFEKEKTISSEIITRKICENLSHLKTSSLKPVINATGVLIHTNLGRAPLSQKALQKAMGIAHRYSTLEFNVHTGKRGDRNDHLEKLLCEGVGSQAALVVNNNAGALFLCLNTLAFQRKVLISRGELIEIGSSFRIPDIMEKSGAYLKEVGTTNRTRKEDYEENCDSETKVILKVHKSNYDIVGFTEEVHLKDLAKLSKSKKKILLFDAGSGLLYKTKWLKQELSIAEMLKAGADIVTFSGDKLLGGPQAGLIVGKKRLIDQLKKNPIYRLLRMDKIVLSVLEETLKYYALEHPEEEIPFLKMLETPLSVLEERAKKLKKSLKTTIEKCYPDVILSPQGEGSFEIKKDIAKIGGGAFPRLSLPTIVLSFQFPKEKLLKFEENLRLPKTDHLPVIGRIQNNRFLIDFRTIFEEELLDLEKTLRLAYTYTYELDKTR